MTSEPTTRPSLLIRIRNTADQDAWSEFVRVYAPLIHHFARGKGLQEADAADITQDVLRQVSDSIGRFHYAPCRGSFRAWLFTVTRNRVVNYYTRDRRAATGSGDTRVCQLLEQQPATEEDQADWDRELDKHLFACAVEKVRPEFRANSWQAFWMTAVENQEASAVAQGLGMSVGAVYIAKSRVLARLRAVVATLADGDALGLETPSGD